MFFFCDIFVFSLWPLCMCDCDFFSNMKIHQPKYRTCYLLKKIMLGFSCRTRFNFVLGSEYQIEIPWFGWMVESLTSLRNASRTSFCMLSSVYFLTWQLIKKKKHTKLENVDVLTATLIKKCTQHFSKEFCTCRAGTKQNRSISGFHLLSQ